MRENTQSPRVVRAIGGFSAANLECEMYEILVYQVTLISYIGRTSHTTALRHWQP